MSLGNCPNCGAPITGPQCEYCGTVHRGLRAKVPGLIDDVYDISKLNEYLEHGMMTPNQARELMGLPRIEGLKWERTILEQRLVEAQTRALDEQERTRRLYEEAIQAMRSYSEV